MHLYYRWSMYLTAMQASVITLQVVQAMSKHLCKDHKDPASILARVCFLNHCYKLGVSSKPLSVISGVPQGSVLGPLLFLIYINGITELPLSPESKLVMYADDILLYRPIRQASDYQRLQQDVEALGKWANDNYLTFNPSKSKAMVFSRKRHPVQAPSYLSLNGSTLEIVDSVKYLDHHLF